MSDYIPIQYRGKNTVIIFANPYLGLKPDTELFDDENIVTWKEFVMEKQGKIIAEFSNVNMEFYNKAQAWARKSDEQHLTRVELSDILKS